MTCYEISFKYRRDIEGLSNAEKATVTPRRMRVQASNLTRAISSVVNELKAEGSIDGKADVIILEGKVVV